MNKADLVNMVAENVDGMTKKQAAEAIEAIFSGITSALGNGDRVQVPGFGTFLISHRAERQGLNPQTKQPMTIKASNSVRFKPGKQLKEAVN